MRYMMKKIGGNLHRSYTHSSHAQTHTDIHTHTHTWARGRWHSSTATAFGWWKTDYRAHRADWHIFGPHRTRAHRVTENKIHFYYFIIIFDSTIPSELNVEKEHTGCRAQERTVKEESRKIFSIFFRDDMISFFHRIRISFFFSLVAFVRIWSLRIMRRIAWLNGTCSRMYDYSVFRLLEWGEWAILRARRERMESVRWFHSLHGIDNWIHDSFFSIHTIPNVMILLREIFHRASSSQLRFFVFDSRFRSSRNFEKIDTTARCDDKFMWRIEYCYWRKCNKYID